MTQFSENTFNSKRPSETEAGHILTPLVDCFAIILIYLLMATSLGQIEFQIPEGMKLPNASEAKAPVTDLVVTVQGNKYSVNGETVSLPNLGRVLKGLFDKNNSSNALIIQADRKLNYGEINPVINAGLLAGFSEIQFAVIKEETM